MTVETGVTNKCGLTAGDLGRRELAPGRWYSGPALTFFFGPVRKKIMEALINYKNIKSQINNRHDK